MGGRASSGVGGGALVANLQDRPDMLARIGAVRLAVGTVMGVGDGRQAEAERVGDGLFEQTIQFELAHDEVLPVRDCLAFG
jgi:hypothetical protein